MSSGPRFPKLQSLLRPAMTDITGLLDRFQLASCSRSGGLPADLQGLWNHSNNPPWAGDYHNNINVQIVLLPAIPPVWAKASSFKGLRARGGHTVDCTWQNGRLTDCQIMTDSGPTPVKIRLNGELREITTTAAITDMGTAAASGPGAAMWQVGKAQAHLPPPVTAPSSPGSGPQANRFKSAASSDRMLKSTDDRRFGGG